MELSRFPMLAKYAGQELVVTDGTTLLGADDKAGIAEIITTVEYLLAHPEREHGPIAIGFTPDEEIGEGPDHFDVAAFGAQYAYTLDGDVEGGIEYENFNAASAKIAVTGVSVHPGSAKDAMENALLIAQELNALLPPDAVPGKTEGYQGFFHLDALTGTTASAHMEYIIRDHDREKFEAKKALMEEAVRAVEKRLTREEFENLWSAVIDIGDADCLSSFTLGFRLGVQLTLEGLRPII